MSQQRRATIVFLTAEWTNVDKNIRQGITVGGVPSVRQIWTTCLSRGHDVQVFVLTELESDWPKQTVELGGVTFHWIRRPFPRSTRWLANRHLIGLAKPLWILWQLQMAYRIRRARVKPDLVYCMRTTFLGLGWLWARLRSAKVVLRQYGSWLYHVWFEQKKWLPRISLLGNLLAQRIPMDLQIMTNDGTQGDKGVQWAGFPVKRLRFWINGVDKAMRIPGFDSAKLKRQLGIATDAQVLVTVGRLTFWKRFDRAIDALPTIRAQFSGAHLVMVGGGELREELENQVRGLGLSDAVTFTGPVTYEEIKGYLNLADLVILPHDLTNMCNTLIEALTAGCCIITRDVGSTTQIVTDDDDAVVLARGEAEDIAQATIEILKDPGRRRRIAATAYARAMQRFQTWDERMEMEVDCLEELIGMDPSAD